MKKYLLCVLVVMSLFSCEKEWNNGPKYTVEDYMVTLLFEYDSVKVYRFWDVNRKRYAYFQVQKNKTIIYGNNIKYRR